MEKKKCAICGDEIKRPPAVRNDYRLKNVIEINSEMANALHKAMGENVEGRLLITKQALENLTEDLKECKVESSTSDGRSYNNGLKDSIMKIVSHLTPPGINPEKKKENG